MDELFLAANDDFFKRQCDDLGLNEEDILGDLFNRLASDDAASASSAELFEGNGSGADGEDDESFEEQ